MVLSHKIEKKKKEKEKEDFFYFIFNLTGIKKLIKLQNSLAAAPKT